MPVIRSARILEIMVSVLVDDRRLEIHMSEVFIPTWSVVPKRSVKCQEASRSGGCQDEISLNVVPAPPRTWPLSGEYECVAIVSVASCTKCFRNNCFLQKELPRVVNSFDKLCLATFLLSSPLLGRRFLVKN